MQRLPISLCKFYISICTLYPGGREVPGIFHYEQQNIFLIANKRGPAGRCVPFNRLRVIRHLRVVNGPLENLESILKFLRFWF